MESNILDDYESLYNSIKNKVIDNKKILCNNTTDDDTIPEDDPCNNINCDTLYTLDINDFKCYLTPKEANSTSIQTVYLKYIYEKIIKIFPLIENTDVDTENIEKTDRSLLQIQKEALKKRKKLINGFSGLVLGIIGIIILVILYLTTIDIQTARAKKDDFITIMGELICNPLTIIILLIFILITFNSLREDRINKIKNKEKRIIIIQEDDISRLHTSITNLKTELEKILCNSDPNIDPEKLLTDSGETHVNINNLSNKFVEFITDFEELQKNNMKNELLKQTQINEINELFNEFKGVLYRTDNKFNNLIEDNSTEIYCLMNLLLNRNKCSDEIKSINCELNNKCGIQGLIDVNSKEGFNNGLEDITNEDIVIFFDKLTKNTFNNNMKYELKNSKLYNIIVNIFIIKIYQNDIKQKDFVKYIKSHFEKINLKENGIEINKFDIITNYKNLINIIYEEYDNFKKLENQKNIKMGNIINKSRFSQIIKLYTIDQFKELENNLKNTIEKIELFKINYKEDIYDEIKNDKLYNKHIENFSYVIIVISVIQFLCNIINDIGDIQDDFAYALSEKLAYISLIILFNMIVFSYWYKRHLYIKLHEMIIKNNNNIFTKNLKLLQEKINEIIIIKDIKNYKNSENKESIKHILNLYHISVTENNENIIFSKYNSGNNYTILDTNDIERLITEGYYNKLIEVMKIYECCSFLNSKPRVALFPWTEFTINIILIGIILSISLNVYQTYNPTYIIDDLRSKDVGATQKNIGKIGSWVKDKVSTAKDKAGERVKIGVDSYGTNKKKTPAQAQAPKPAPAATSSSTTNMSGATTNMSGGNLYDNRMTLLYPVVTLLSMYYSYHIYYNTVLYEENLYKSEL